MNIGIEELLAIDIDNLATIQYEVLKKDTCDKLRNIIDLIEKEEFEKIIDEYISYSPAGDSMGTESYFITLANEFDIGEVLELLIKLKDIIEE